MRGILLGIFLFSLLSVQAQEKNWNDYYKEDFSPFEKGSWFTAISLGLHNTESENDEFLFQDIIENRNKDYNINISAAYFIQEEFAAGAKFNYSFEERNVHYVNSSGDSIQRNTAGNKFIFTPFIRNYIPISKNKRFNIYNDTELSFGFGNQVNREETDPDNVEKFYEKQFITRLGISPGINVFIVKKFSFEMGLNLIGLEYEKIKKKFGEDKEGSVENFDFDFKISLLSLNFGLAYYF